MTNGSLEKQPKKEAQGAKIEAPGAQPEVKPEERRERNIETKKILQAISEVRRGYMSKIDKELKSREPGKKIFDAYELTLAQIGTNLKLGVEDIFKTIDINQPHKIRDKQFEAAKILAPKYIEVIKASLYRIVTQQKGPEKKRLTHESFQKLVSLSEKIRNIALLAEKDKPFQEAFTRVIHSAEGEKLEEKDIGTLLQHIDNVKADNIDALKLGTVIGMMHPNQKLQFAKTVIDKRPEKAPQFLDALLRTGNLSVTQGIEAFSYAEKKGIKLPSLADKKGKFNEEEYVKAQEEFDHASRGKIEQMVRPYENPALKMLTLKNVGGLLVTVWGFVMAALNIIVAVKAKRPGSLLTNPYVYLSGAAVGTGRAMRGLPAVPFGEDLGDFFKMEKEIRSEEKEQHRKALIEVYMNRPTFARYLDNGGFATLRKVREAKEKMGEKKKRGEKHPLYITAKELIDAEPDATRKNTLKNLLDTYKAEIFERDINVVAQTAYTLAIHDQDRFNQFVKESRAREGLET